jgi:hypothetical protein
VRGRLLYFQRTLEIVQHRDLHSKYKGVLVGQTEACSCDGCWEIWPEAVDDFEDSATQQNEIRSYNMLADKVPGVEEADVQEFLDSHSCELTKEGLEQLTLLNTLEVKEILIVVVRP